MTALMYVLFGDSDFTARLAPILMGLSMVAAVLAAAQADRPRRARSRRRCCSPSARATCTSSRFAREDIYVAAITLALLVVIWRFLEKPRKFYPALIGLCLAASFATKETTFITVFVMGSFFLVALAIPQWRPQVWGAGDGRRAGRAGAGSWPRSPGSSRSSSRRS